MMSVHKQGAISDEPPRHVAQRTGPSWWLIAPLGTGAAVVIIAVTVGVTLSLVSASAPDEEAEVETFTVFGSLLLDGGGSLNVSEPFEGGACEGSRGYSDIGQGAQAKVTAPDGKILAIGRLEQGEMYEPGLFGSYDRNGVCRFRFEVAEVPAGHGLYGIEVANRGVVTFEEERLGTVSDAPTLTLG